MVRLEKPDASIRKESKMADREKEQQLNDEVFRNAAAYAGAVKPTYAGTFEDQLKGIYDKIANREAFNYDVNADPLYDIYKDKYIQQGKLAMKDTMGQAAALTGGYGSTYGQQVGQQTYDAYLQNLSDVIPELYGLAYQRYQDEGDDLMNQYGMLGDLRDQEYGQYRDELSDYNYGQEVQRQLEDMLYSRRINEENTAWNRQQEEAQTAWERQQAAYKNLIQTISTTAYQPSDAELAAAGMSREEAEAVRAQALREWAVKMDQIYGTGGSSGGGRSGGGGGGGGGSSGYGGSSGTGSAGFTVDSAGDLIYTGTAEQYYNLSDDTRKAAEAAVAAQEKGKSMTEYYKKKYGK